MDTILDIDKISFTKSDNTIKITGEPCWHDIKTTPPPEYDWIILGYINDFDLEIWQIGRHICGKFELYTGDGPCSGDSFWDFETQQVTHWLKIPYIKKD